MRFTRDRDLILSFDNTAIQELRLRELLLKSEWDSVYNGQIFSHTVLVDAVEGYFAPTSFSGDDHKVSWSSTDLIKYFRTNHDKAFN